MWLLGRLTPDHKTIADFRKDNGLALRKVCARFVELCREMGMGLLATASVAIDGSKVVNPQRSRCFEMTQPRCVEGIQTKSRQ
jgi:transposase